MDVELEAIEFDEELLTSLGVNVVDRDKFEQDFLDKLEEQFKDHETSEANVGTPDAQIDECEIADGETGLPNDPSCSEEVDQNEVETGSDLISEDATLTGFLTGKTPHTSSTAKSRNEVNCSDAGSSMLKSLLLVSSRNRQKEVVETETETEKQVRAGIMTPFGNLIEKGAPKKDSFLEFSLYMQKQIKLNKEFQEKKKQMKVKKQTKHNSKLDLDGGKSSKRSDCEEVGKESESDEDIQEAQKTKRKLKKTDSIDMNILFPKNRRKKPTVGTSTSEDPGNARRKPGKSLAERTGMYINESEDSDYIPPTDSDCSEGTNQTSRRQPTARGSTKRKRRNNYKEDASDSDEDYEGSDVEIPIKRRKKITDDGHMQSYKKRLENWKINEIRFTGEMHEMEGNFKIPIHLWESLYDYQKVGVKWLWELHQERSGGILGDEMGLGKTIQVIAFLAGVSCSNLLFRFSPFRGLGPSLIVCPATVMHQWVREFHTWWPPFRIAILHESGSFSGTKLNLIRCIHETKGILVTTYAGIVNNQDEILKHRWDYVVVDEGHKIRNPDAKLTLTLKQLSTPHRLILSGSPLQNNLKELWSLFDFIYPGKLGTLPVFLEQFAVPITQGGYANASDIQVASAFKCATVLRKIISPYLLRRMKSDVRMHLNLPPKNEQVLFCKLTEEQRESYVGYLRSDQVSSIINGRYEIFVGLIYLRKICNHPHLYDGGPKVYKDLGPKLNRVPKNKIKNRRRIGTNDGLSDVEVEEESDIDLDPDRTFGHWSKSGKMIVVRTLLKLWKRQEHKVLLFTQSRQMLCILENFIRSENYTYLRLDGSTSIGSRQPMIEKFNEEPSIFIFILTTKVGGLGVNLTGGNRVIIFDPDWNPSTDLQARERAWRIGQNRQVTIYRLITSGTIEEKIYHRQIFKQFLTNRVLKNPKQKRFFKRNDMLELFTLNEGKEGTETQAIFAGTGSNVKVPKRQKPVERKSGKFRRIPYLDKQAVCKPDNRDSEDGEDNSTSADMKASSSRQDDYVLRKLFKKSGVEAAMRHDRIVDTNESDYLLVEKEAERVATDAVNALKKSIERCWAADSGNVTWTGQSGAIRPLPSTKKRGLDFNKKSKNKLPTPKPPSSPVEVEGFGTSFFSKPKVKETDDVKEALSSKDLLTIMRNRKRPIIESQNYTEGSSEEQDESSTSSSSVNATNKVHDVHMELLREIREFIAFRAMVDGQASTKELLSEFATKLPAKDSPLFKQLLNKLCTHRQVEGRRIWRLKPEFR